MTRKPRLHTLRTGAPEGMTPEQAEQRLLAQGSVTEPCKGLGARHLEERDMERERKRLEIIALELAELLSLWATKEQRAEANDKARQLAQGFGYKLAARRDPDADPWKDLSPHAGYLDR